MKCGDWRANGRRVSWVVLLLAVCGLCACAPAKPGDTSADTQLTDTVLDVPLGTDTAIFDLTLPETALECPGSPGCACSVDPDCNTGLCLETAAGRLCATLCVDSCPAGFVCRSTPVAGDPLSYCAPVGVQQCAPCQTKADCNAAWSFPAECIDAGLAGSFCASTCSLSSDCPDTYQCVDVAGQGKVCQPQGGMEACTCSPWATTSGNITTCDVLEGTLACPGTRTCDATGLTACTKLAGEPCADAGCKDAKDGSTCDDGDPCTQSECQAGVCSATTNFCKCQQSSDCTDDGDLCNGVPFCDKSAVPYSCKVNPATVVTCPAPSGPCKSQVCSAASGTCSEINVQDGNTCTDDDPCFANKTCLSGQCQGGIQTCACTKTSDCTALDNNDLCDGSLYCDLVSHSCKINPASIVQCPASGKPCEVTSCLPATGQCATAAKPEAAPCEDGAACTVGDFCQGGQCLAGTVTCNCQKDADCATYEDGDACNGVLFCNKATSKCQINPKTIVQCQSGDNTECQENLCDPKSGACAMAYAATTTLCEDGNPCSASDHCDGSGGCTSSVDICPCDNDGDCAASEDGNLCNGTLYCDLTTKTCQLNPATVVTCPWSGDNPCAPIECQPLTGQCEPSPLLAGGCDDGDPCTAKGSCVAGVCKSGPNLCQCKTSADCLPFDDANLCNGKLFCDVTSGQCKPNPASIVTCPAATDACSQNACDPVSGKCSLAVGKDGSWCDDGETCTKSDACLDGACQPGTLVCDCLTTADCADKEDGNLCNGTLFCDKSGPEPACVLNPASVVKCPDTGATCTDPVCLPDTGTCTQQAVAGDCTDNNACTSGDVCENGVCLSGSAVTCNDDNPCTDDSCNPASGCVFAPNTAPCDDDNLCTQLDVCNAGSCEGQNPVQCTALNQCHDVGSCDVATGLCTDPTKTDNSGCDDGDACTQSDTCQAGSCVGASPVVCTALDQCHDVGVCDSETGACSQPAKPDDSDCDDDNACTLIDTCQAGSCTGSDLLPCPAPDQCHDLRVCDPASGVCSNPNKADDTACNDGNACTKADTCQSGTCTGASPVICTALDQCHDIGTCNATTGVCDNPTKADNSSCSDGDACTQSDTCQAGSCVGSDPLLCPAPDQCHELSVCDPGTGVCSNPNKADDTACDDGNFCTQTDTCQSGTCTGVSPVICTALDQCHDIGVCDTTTGICNNPAKADASGCNDGDLCTQSDTCQAGSCVGANPVTCSELDQCHDAGVCDPQTGACSNPNKADDTPCQDSSACTENNTCQGGACTVGSTTVCTALDQCHDVGVCDPDTGICSDPAKTNGSSCTDNSACTQVDSCQGGSCVGNVPVTCTAQDKCHDAGICDPGTGSCSNPEKADGTTCQDGNACTEQETCQQGNCQNGVPVSCDDSNPCTNDSCDTGTGCAHSANTVSCDDGSACTEQDTCAAGSCAGAAVACDDNNRYTNNSCDPAVGCKYLAREICNGADDDGDGTSDNVLCGGLSCTCDNGVTRCQPGCTACPDPDDYPIAIDDGGTDRVICAHSWPHWGTAPDSPNTFLTQGDGTVTDALTGLQWQQVLDPGSYTWTAAAPYCDGLVLGGKTDWRLPTLAELSSLTDLTKALAPTVDVVKFPSTPDNLFWAAESFRGAGIKGWTVSTGTGVANSYTVATTNWASVRCVRSVSSVPRPSQRWKIVADNAVTIDLRTGLQWQRQPSATGGPNLNGQYSWGGAASACTSLELGGHDDWRLPSLRELQSIVDLQKTASPTWDSYAFPGSYAGIWGYYWTSTLFQASAVSAWVVEFASGATSNRSPGDQYDVRCVRNPVCGDGTCDSGEDMRCVLDCGCTVGLTGQACNDGNACTTGETCANGVCTGTSTIVCDDGWVGSSDSCDPQTGCRYSWPEVCNGQDDNFNGTTDDVMCGSATCTCDGGVTLCEATCTTCPDPGDLAIPIATAAGNKVVCAHDYPAWGLQSDSFNSYVVHGDGTATDSKTGLMWQQASSAAASDWDTAVANCDSSAVAGYTDWRLPTMAEMLSIVTYNQTSFPFVDTTVFPDTFSTDYWTYTKSGTQTTSGLVVSLADGRATSLLLSSTVPRARCVRSATSPAAKAQRWTKTSGAQSVLDDLTGVRWLAAPPLTGGDGTGKYAFDAAVVVCNDLVLDGYSDWRLPRLREMTSILRYGKAASPMVDSEVFAGWPSSGGQQYWTTTLFDNSTVTMLAVNTNPGVILAAARTNVIRPICVRAPECGDGVCEDAEKSSCFADCGCTAQLEGKACSDNNACTTGETCTGGTCGGSTPVNCDDTNPCTTESCTQAGGCFHTPNTNPCDDGNLCTLTDTCNGGSCVGTVKVCADEWSDNTDTCIVETGACLHVWSEVCNGVDDDFNGETDDVTCGVGGPACACVNGVMECPSDCSICLGALAQAIDDAGTAKVICTADHATWGILPLTPTAYTDNSDGTVSDLATGLQWQKAQDTNDYTWPNAKTYCDGLSLGGKTDWRLPTFAELESLVDYNKGTSPAIHNTFFPGAAAADTWTGTWVLSNLKALFINFSDGSSGTDTFTSTGRRVRCVRSQNGKPFSARRWLRPNADVVHDLRTGLTWQHQPPSTGGDGTGKYSFSGAATYCTNLSLGGFDNWRAPTVRELTSVRDYVRSAAPWVNPEAFALPGSGFGFDYWSGTTYRGGATKSWGLSFEEALTMTSPTVGTLYRPLCVRDTTCGDGICTQGETKASCSADCP